jgi:uncharacterized protein YndB with AHSA1/START domain
MTTQADPESTVRTAIVVEVPQERAFAVFTERFGEFKPPEHNIMATPIVTSVFEPRVGGHLYDIGADGTRCRFGRVLAYDPPNRVVFSWDISPAWQLETDPARTSEVEIRFVVEAADRTRVEIEHRHLDRHGDGWLGISAAVRSEGGWPVYLSRYAALLGAS